jgi:tetratricopeptide (TPR) repeat protein
MKEDFSEAWLNLGILYEEKKKFQKAKECYEKALSNPLYLTPEAAYYRLALLYEKEGNLEMAKRELSLSIRNNTDFFPAYVELAKILEREGKNEKAKEIYYNLIELFPNNQYPYCALGELYKKEGKYREAKKYLGKCISIAPKSPLSAKARAELEELGE